MFTEAQNGDWLIIEGISEDNVRFRPSDWAERISSVLASYGADHRLHYSREVYPSVIDDQKCVVVAKTLRDEQPQLYEFILKFARDNHLKVHEEHRLQTVVVESHEQDADFTKLRA